MLRHAIFQQPNPTSSKPTHGLDESGEGVDNLPSSDHAITWPTSTYIHTWLSSGNKSEVWFVAPQKGPTLARILLRAIKKDPINVQGGKKAKRLFADDGRTIRPRKKVLAQCELP